MGMVCEFQMLHDVAESNALCHNSCDANIFYPLLITSYCGEEVSRNLACSCKFITNIILICYPSFTSYKICGILERNLQDVLCDKYI
jgi:hypothetical protein